MSVTPEFGWQQMALFTEEEVLWPSLFAQKLMISLFSSPIMAPPKQATLLFVSYKLALIGCIVGDVLFLVFVREKHPGPVQVGQSPLTLSSNCQFVARSTVDRITEAGGRGTKAHFCDRAVGGYLIFLQTGTNQT